MSRRYQAGIVLPGYNALKVANAPTIGAATAGAAQVSVAFTAPSCTGGGAITSYTAFANCGIKTASGASSPVVVTGLTNGTAYTFKVIATNAYGPSYPSCSSNSATPIAQGQQAYTTAGTYSWVAPSCVTSVSVVAVGAGSGGGGGGALAYKNNITVVPGNSYAVVVGAAGVSSGGGGCGTNGGFSRFTASFGSMTAGGAQTVGTIANGGTPSGTYDAGYSGGYGSQAAGSGYNGGGAAGYAGGGGNTTFGGNGTAGAGGGGGGGGWAYWGGGGVGILGQGANGAGGVGAQGGRGGSGGANGTCTTGGAYGGGAPGNPSGNLAGVGAVRIIWPGNTRSFPSTCTGNL